VNNLFIGLSPFSLSVPLGKRFWPEQFLEYLECLVHNKCSINTEIAHLLRFFLGVQVEEAL
jgi:hypothetical protein